MSSRPPDAVQADAFGLSQEERIRLAYRLLKSLSADAASGLPAGVDGPAPQSEQPSAQASIPDLSPPPHASAPATSQAEPRPSTAATSANPYADWETESLETTFEKPRGHAEPRVVYLRLALPEWLSKGMVATSLVGGAAALFMLGVLYQRRESAASTAWQSLLSTVPSEQHVTYRELPTIEAASDISPSPVSPSQPADSTPVDERPAPVQAAPTPAAPQAPPLLKIPAISSFADALVLRDTVVANPGPSLVPPTAPAAIGNSLDIASPPAFRPRQLRDSSAINAAAVFARLPSPEPAARPTNIPASSAGQRFDVAPQVRNMNRIQQALQREYPSSLRAWGIEGRAEMVFYVNEHGVVDSFELKKTSGNRSLDQAAMRVANLVEFSPARRGEQPVAGWVSLEMVFSGS